MNSENPIDTAIKAVGSMSVLAERCDVTYQAIQRWRKQRVPAERVRQIEKATGGQITRFQLRPDLYEEPSKTA